MGPALSENRGSRSADVIVLVQGESSIPGTPRSLIWMVNLTRVLPAVQTPMNGASCHDPGGEHSATLLFHTLSSTPHKVSRRCCALEEDCVVLASRSVPTMLDFCWTGDGHSIQVTRRRRPRRVGLFPDATYPHPLQTLSQLYMSATSKIKLIAEEFTRSFGVTDCASAEYHFHRVDFRQRGRTVARVSAMRTAAGIALD